MEVRLEALVSKAVNRMHDLSFNLLYISVSGISSVLLDFFSINFRRYANEFMEAFSEVALIGKATTDGNLS